VGLGPFKQGVPEDVWLQAAEKQVAEDGAEQYLVNMLFTLKESFKQIKGHPSRDISIETDNAISTGVGPFPRLVPDEQWIRASAAKMREQGVTVFMREQLCVILQNPVVRGFASTHKLIKRIAGGVEIGALAQNRVQRFAREGSANAVLFILRQRVTSITFSLQTPIIVRQSGI
jgi:hypothetical protein